MKQPTFEEVSKRLSYSEATGEVHWLKNNRLAGYKSKKGYIQIRLDDKLYFAHRIAFLLKTGEWPKNNIDHEDRNPSNNKWINLRVGSQSDNMKNSSLRSDNKSGYKGVSWRNDTKKWSVRLRLKDKYLCLGSFSNKEDAAKAYNIAAEQHYKEWANLNIIKEGV